MALILTWLRCLKKNENFDLGKEKFQSKTYMRRAGHPREGEEGMQKESGIRGLSELAQGTKV